MFPWLKDKKTILTHNNPYAIEEQNWNDVTVNVGNNGYITKRLKEITDTRIEQIPITVDTDYWKFQREWKPGVDKVNPSNGYEWKTEDAKPTVMMVANRIESKKGILPVAIACGELGVKFVLVGAISNAGYMEAIRQTGVVEFHEQISDEKLRELYYKATIHVCNSVDGFESGTMPILESMLCGVPVLTRMVGHVPDIYNGSNMVIQEADSEDVEAIQNKLHEMLSDRKKLDELRDKGWNSVKNRTHELRALAYQKLYRSVMHDTTPVSVILPVTDNPETVRKTLDAIANQTYKNIELIVADDGDGSIKPVVENFSNYVNIPVRYMYTGNNDYGLARARNEAAIEATGELLVFCDQRMVMDEKAVEVFVTTKEPKAWSYGSKGAKKEFVENFSCVDRRDFMNFGMFNERMTMYGGLSQETRTRLRNQNMVTKYIPEAKATPKGSSSNKNTKRGEIIKMKARLIKMDLT